MPTIVIAATEAAPSSPAEDLVTGDSTHDGLELAGALLADVVGVATSVVDDVIVVLDPDSPLRAPDGARELRPPYDEEDERVAAALVGLDGPVLVLRTRTPQLTAAMVTDLLESLEGPFGDAVCGLTVDEAWWVVGLARPDPSALLGVPMRGPGSGRHVLDRLHGLGLALGLSDRLLAAESVDDLGPLAEESAGTRFAELVTATD